MYVALTYHWGGALEVEAGPEVWVERPQVGLTWVQMAPCLVTVSTDDGKAQLESRLNTWLQRPDRAYARP
jgi:hypothetical protein